MKNYILYHVHDTFSNCNGYYDSVTSFEEYLKLAKRDNMNAIGISNHGNIFEWIKRKQQCDKAGIKYIHGIETYLCLNQDDTSSYHIGLYAKNLDGVKELNTLISKSTLKDGHFYRVPRIFMSELKQTSDNIIITTACLASPIWKLKDYQFSDDFVEFLSKNKHRSFLEIQYHNHIDQIQYNKLLLKYSKEYDIPLIAGTDTHSATQYHAECRKILQKSNGSYYGDEDSFDLTWKTYDELVQCFKTQNSIPENEYIQAIDNTNILADMIEHFDLDYSFKYPGLYENPKTKFMALVDREFSKMVNKGIIQNNDKYLDRMHEEIEAFKKQGMESFLLFTYELCRYCDENNIIYRPRGSVNGSLVAYVLGIIYLDPVELKAIFSRFCNEDRISLADIDLDFAPEDREKVYEYIRNRFSANNTSYIAQFGKIKDRGTFDILGRGLDMNNLDEIKNIKNDYENIIYDYKKIIQESINLDEHNIENDISSNDELCKLIGNVEIVSKLNMLNDKYMSLKKKYKDIFYYFDGLKGTIITKGNHPAGMIGSPIDLIENVGVWYKDGDINFPVSTCSMKQIDSLNYCKFDILGVKMIGIIKDVYDDIGLKSPKYHEINWNDKNVYNEIKESKVGCFQFEGEYAFEQLKNFKPENLYDITLVTAAIRPSGSSYRDKLLKREFNKNPSPEIDKLLEDNYGYIVYQEDTIKFLQQICSFSGGEADTIRRAISKKILQDIYDNKEKIIKGYQNNFNKDYNIAKQEIEDFIKMLIDASRYQFGYNHAIGYTLNTYIGMYLRYYYTIQFITAYLNRATNTDDYYDGAVLAKHKKIKLNNISFGKSYAKYKHDIANNTIYKGLQSIKYIGSNLDNKLTSIYSKQYNDFIDILDEFFIFFDRKQIHILILLNYFHEFGTPNYLEIQFDIYLEYKGRKQLTKSKLSKTILNCFKDVAHSETDKLIKGFNYIDLIKEIVKYKKSLPYNYLELLKNEYIYYSYVHSTLKCDSKFALVLDIKIDNVVSMFVYHMNSGIHKRYKMFKNIFYKHQNYDNINLKQRFKIFDIIIIKNINENQYGSYINDFDVKNG